MDLLILIERLLLTLNYVLYNKIKIYKIETHCVLNYSKIYFFHTFDPVKYVIFAILKGIIFYY